MPIWLHSGLAQGVAQGWEWISAGRSVLGGIINGAPGSSIRTELRRSPRRHGRGHGRAGSNLHTPNAAHDVDARSAYTRRADVDARRLTERAPLGEPESALTEPFQLGSARSLLLTASIVTSRKRNNVSEHQQSSCIITLSTAARVKPQP